MCASLVTLLCRTAKLGWFDSDTHRAIVDDAKLFLEKGTPAHYLVGLRILNTIVQVSARVRARGAAGAGVGVCMERPLAELGAALRSGGMGGTRNAVVEGSGVGTAVRLA